MENETIIQIIGNNDTTIEIIGDTLYVEDEDNE